MDWERKVAVASFVLALGALGMASAAWFETIRSTEVLQEQLEVMRAREQARAEETNPVDVKTQPGLAPAAEPVLPPPAALDEPPPAATRGPSEADLRALGEQLARLGAGEPFTPPSGRGAPASASQGKPGAQAPLLPELQDVPPVEPAPDKWELAAAKRRVAITMYATKWCGVCRQARTYMKKEGISFTERDVEASQTASRRHREINPRGTVPTFDIDGQVLIGFNQARFEDALSRAARSRL